AGIRGRRPMNDSFGGTQGGPGFNQRRGRRTIPVADLVVPIGGADDAQSFGPAGYSYLTGAARVIAAQGRFLTSARALRAPPSIVPPPNDRLTQFLHQSEDLRQVKLEWSRFWFTDHPSHLTPDPVDARDNPEWIQNPWDGWFDRREIPSLLYHRPSYSGDERFFFDLVSYAPGMSVSRADVLATIEAEAGPAPASKPGRIDKAAQNLFIYSGRNQWYTYTTGDLTITYDHEGRYVSERTLPPGIRERVVCD